MSMLTMRASPIRMDLRLGTFGYASCLVFSISAAVLAPGWRIVPAFTLALVLALIFYREGLANLRSKRLWVFGAFLLASSTLMMDSEGGYWGGLALGIQMALRAVAITLAVGGFATSVPIGELAGLLERVGMPGLGFALGVAVNMLPTVQETATQAYHALRLRGGFRKRPLHALRLLFVTLVVNTLRHADDIVSAAEARAFSPDHSRALSVRGARADLPLAAGLLLTTAILLAF